ncbi:Fur family transcriptional regulator [Haloimpatiens sp. FM7315]|uniref:Fur family transcriptional regulator n=1 Tax=Haloimpatiens sp. FM7315 TaxID=3298609 RepID=UPI0035A2D82F
MDRFRGVLKENNIKCTKGRLSILKILEENKEAANAERIYEKCSKEGVKIDLSTVYRTLELFEKMSLIEKFDIGEGKYNYLFKEHNHKHILHCKLCDKNLEIDCPMPQVSDIIKSKTGFVLVEEEIKFSGICKDCAKINKRKEEK